MTTVIRFAAAILLLAVPLAAEAQQAGKVYRIGYLSAGSRESQESLYQALLRGLIGRGWIEGQNLMLSVAGPTDGMNACPLWRQSWFSGR